MAGYIGSKTSVTVVSTETDSRYVNVAGDTMTGALAVNGDLTVDTNTLFVDAANNRVGIGTSSPSRTLQVDGSGNRVASFTHSAGTYAFATFSDTNTTDDGQVRIGALTNDLLAFAGGSERMRINSAGNVGIGTSSVATNFRQEIVGLAGSNSGPASSGTTQDISAVMRIRPGGGFTAALDIGQGGGNGSWLQSTDTTNLATNYPLFLNPNGGNVGIGTSSPNGKLEIYSNAGVGSASSALVVDQTSESGAAALSLTSLFTNANVTNKEVAAIKLGVVTDGSASPSADIRFETINSNTLSERLRITSSGNVGIGTSSPSERVTIGANSSDTALSGTSNTQGLHMYQRTFGIAQIDSLVSGTSNSGMSLRTYNNGTYTPFIENIQGNTTTFATAGTERMRITSSGNVGIGTTTPDVFSRGDEKHVGVSVSGASDNLALSLNAGGSATRGAQIYMGQGGTRHLTLTSNATESTVETASSTPLKFATNATERMRIDASGNLLVGKTSTSNLVTTAGHVFYGNGEAFFTRAGTPLFLGRTGSDGSIVNFYKDGVAVGSIGVTDGDNLFISSTASAHGGLKFNNTAMAAYVDGANSDGTMDVGTSAVRFKDLYLSGGVYLGGTTSANLLDDYEEGTFTPFVGSSDIQPSVSYSAQSGWYRKVGSVVHFVIDLTISSISGGNGVARISNLPFTKSLYSDSGYGAIGLRYGASGALPSSKKIYGHSMFIDTTFIYFYGTNSSGSEVSIGPTELGAGRLYIYGTYFT